MCVLYHVSGDTVTFLPCTLTFGYSSVLVTSCWVTNWPQTQWLKAPTSLPLLRPWGDWLGRAALRIALESLRLPSWATLGRHVAGMAGRSGSTGSRLTPFCLRASSSLQPHHVVSPAKSPDFSCGSSGLSKAQKQKLPDLLRGSFQSLLLGKAVMGPA